MRIRMIVAGLLALLFFPLLPATPAAALSCIDSVSAFDHLDVVVEATVTNRPSKNQMLLTVARYFKGTGPATIQARVEGIEPGNDSWINNPLPGKTYLLGFVQRDGKLVHRPCDIFHEVGQTQISAELAQKMGEGTPPAAGGTTGQAGEVPEATSAGLPWRTILPVAGVVLLVAAGVGFALRMRSR